MRHEALRFLLAGGLAALSCYSLYGTLVFLNVNLYFAMISGYALGYVVNFNLGRRWVFRQGRRLASIGTEVLATLAVTLAGMALNLFLLWWLTAPPLGWTRPNSPRCSRPFPASWCRHHGAFVKHPAVECRDRAGKLCPQRDWSDQCRTRKSMGGFMARSRTRICSRRFCSFSTTSSRKPWKLKTWPTAGII